MFVGAFLERGVFTLFFCLVICVRPITLACMVTSRLWRLVTSRLGSSRSAPTWWIVSDRHDPPTFLGVDVHYLRFTSAIPFRDMTFTVMVETVGNDLWRAVTSPFCDLLRIGCIGNESGRWATNHERVSFLWQELLLDFAWINLTLNADKSIIFSCIWSFRPHFGSLKGVDDLQVYQGWCFLRCSIDSRACCFTSQ